MLLALPREIRDILYDILFQYTEEPPASPAESRAGRISFHGSDPEYYPHGKGKPLPGAACAALQCTCRQLRAECREAIERSGGLRYKLDVMIEDELSIFPTWLSLPPLATFVPVVERGLPLLRQG